MAKEPFQPRAAAAGRGLEPFAAALRRALAEAETALSAGEPQESERCAKAVSALARAARDVIELESIACAQPQEDNEEELRAELRRRIARLVDAERAHPAAEPAERGRSEASAA